MTIPPHTIDDPAALRRALAAAGVIPARFAGHLRVARIGIGFGLSGRTARVVVADEPARRLVVKQDTSAVIRREQLFYTRYAGPLAETVPGYLGAVFDGDVGLLVLEDVAPAQQLDVLTGCDDATAERLVSALATLHATTWTDPASIDPALPRWRRRALTADEWTARLGRARHRFPDVLDDTASAALHDVPDRVARALDRLASGPHCWIHADAHLDNMLRRPDGGGVVLDWATSCMGPPLVDLAGLLAGGLIDDPTAEARMTPLIETYIGRLAHHGIRLDVDQAVAAAPEAVLPWVQGIVGWAATPELPTGRAREVLRAQLAVAVAWAR